MRALAGVALWCAVAAAQEAPPSPWWERPIPAFAHAPDATAGAAQHLGEALAKHYGAEADYADQRGRLRRLGVTGDPFKLPIVAHVLREPWQMPAVARAWAGGGEGVGRTLPVVDALGLDRGAPEAKEPALPAPPPAGATAAEWADAIAGVVEDAAADVDRAFANLSAAERARLAELVPLLSTLFIDELMWPLGQDRRKAEATECVRLIARVDRMPLFRAIEWLQVLPRWRERMVADLTGEGELARAKTRVGDVVIAGTGRDWHRKPCAVLVDLGGDDFCTVPSAGPVSVIVDCAGDDAYEATFDVAFGAGVMGVSLLYDASGNDRYLAQRWGLGAGLCGVGVLLDEAGDDVYRGSDYTMGVALQGGGLLIDRGGNDRYEAPRYSQGVGLPGGYGALEDVGDGADRYFCKGRDKTGYGDDGIFDGWGQGVGVGFRGLASGGLGVLRDGGGDDVYEAGNFSQGGGYYFGWGALVDRGGNDVYIGSRYAQAFAAHQAVGYFADEAGNDRYTTRQGVAQGCSWDETVTAFIDRAGDDTYDGGRFFSQGAAAHNGFSLFIDYAGTDAYTYQPGQAQAKSNDYHGGTSFALFLDLGGADDTYVGGKNVAANTRVAHRDTHGFQVDAAGDLADALARFRDWIVK